MRVHSAAGKSFEQLKRIPNPNRNVSPQILALSHPRCCAAGQRRQSAWGRGAAAPRVAAIRSQVGAYSGSASSHDCTVFASSSP